MDAAAAACHLVSPDGQIVGGGTRRQGREPSMARDELEALRATGMYESLVGSVAVDGLPNGVQYAPSAWRHRPAHRPLARHLHRGPRRRLPVARPDPLNPSPNP